MGSSECQVFALSKELQFYIFGKYFPLFGGLHIQQSLIIHSQVIGESDLMERLNLHKVSTIGLSAVVDVNNIKRATYYIQVTSSALYIKLKKVAAIVSSINVPRHYWLHQKLTKQRLKCFSF